MAASTRTDSTAERIQSFRLLVLDTIAKGNFLQTHKDLKKYAPNVEIFAN